MSESLTPPETRAAWLTRHRYRDGEQMNYVCCERCGEEVEIHRVKRGPSAGELTAACPRGCKQPVYKLSKSLGPVPPAPTPGKRLNRNRGPKVDRVLSARDLRQKEIGRTLRDARQRLGFSPVTLGEKIGRASKSFSVWESGGAAIGRHVVPQLASVLELAESQLINQVRAE